MGPSYEMDRGVGDLRGVSIVLGVVDAVGFADGNEGVVWTNSDFWNGLLKSFGSIGASVLGALNRGGSKPLAGRLKWLKGFGVCLLLASKLVEAVNPLLELRL